MTIEKHISIGLNQGEYGGVYNKTIFSSIAYSFTTLEWWNRTLSKSTIVCAGILQVFRKFKKSAVFMAPCTEWRLTSPLGETQATTDVVVTRGCFFLIKIFCPLGE